jgi:hypothetical protein
MTETIENKICPFKAIAENDSKKCLIPEEDKNNEEVYGYCKCLKCPGHDDNCVPYKQLKEYKLI